ncbi:hypothetical protein M569_00138 [Genlisea aurea]|uniref:Uncharacterized protein n=1 Tax=Genlisea aurea TaxID=192259 RepID=S8D4D7_9LAMI|nr:hypothetical protein M569_00138 [Genlisea aurea]
MGPTTPFLLFFLPSIVAGKTPLFPAIFVFGDSTVDPGNNNYIPTISRADHAPYGRNFPGKAATGRFTDGKLIPDILASMVGLKETIPPYLDPSLSDEDIVTGVSFASGGSGYDEKTTALTGAIHVLRQLEYFNKYISRLEGIVGKSESAGILSRSLAIISCGTNDLVLSYYDIPTEGPHFNVDQYQDFLLDKLRFILKALYDLGVRKIAVAGLPPIGCLPLQLTVWSPLLRECIEDQNSDVEVYNAKLQNLLSRTRDQLKGSIILYADIFTVPIDIVRSPHKYGLVETKLGCCGSGALEAGPICTELSPVCGNVEEYMFFDSIHPTESVYKIVTRRVVTKLVPLFLNNNTHTVAIERTDFKF